MANRVDIKIISVPVLCYNTGLLVKTAIGYWETWQERSEQLDTIKKMIQRNIKWLEVTYRL